MVCLFLIAARFLSRDNELAPTNANACGIWDSSLFTVHHPCGLGKGCNGVHSCLLWVAIKSAILVNAQNAGFPLTFGVPPACAKELCAGNCMTRT
jgi:hypothetical protein